MLLLNCDFYGSIINLNRSVLNRFYIFEIRSDFVTRALRRSALGFDSAYAPLKMTNEVGRRRSRYGRIITLRGLFFAAQTSQDQGSAFGNRQLFEKSWIKNFQKRLRFECCLAKPFAPHLFT